VKIKVIKEWNTKAGLKAVAVLNLRGFINGYVESPKILNLMSYDEIENKYQKTFNHPLLVHGGLTFSNKPYWKKDNNSYWYGFDTAHNGDGYNFELVEKELQPFNENEKKLIVSLKETYSNFSEGEFKDLEYVVDNCEGLASQLKELENKVKGK